MKIACFSTVSSTNGKKALGDRAVAMVTKQKLFYQLEMFRDLEGYR